MTMQKVFGYFATLSMTQRVFGMTRQVSITRKEPNDKNKFSITRQVGMAKFKALHFVLW